MSKINLIIHREYITRVKKKSFIIMTLVGPLLMAALFVVPVIMANMEDDEKKTFAVKDTEKLFAESLKRIENYEFNFVSEVNIDSMKADFEESGYYAFVNIGDSTQNYAVQMYSFRPVSLSVKQDIRAAVEKTVRNRNYRKLGISSEAIAEAKTDVSVKTIVWTEDGEKSSSSELNLIIGYIAAIIIYMFVFMYGVQVMRGVIEEKSNRIIEVIVSSVKPFQLMAGKISGIALVALTQFLLWVILTAIIVSILGIFMPDINPSDMSGGMAMGADGSAAAQDFADGKIAEIMAGIYGFNWVKLGISFIFYFLGGYLLYASLFAAIGAAVDNETDTQQFMLPVTIPLILSIVAAQGVVQDADGALAEWLSLIPFTSPIIMPIRAALTDIPLWQFALSALLLIGTFFATTWLAGKIYRTGILMYGKKVSYKELWKWVRYR